jgi:TonB-linked SusC/RagA family outer membrane protein
MKRKCYLWVLSTLKRLIVELKLAFLIIVVSSLNVLTAPAEISDLDTDFQKQVVITGTVTDVSTGEALPGVNIQVKGTNTGAITDGNGKYTIAFISDQSSILVFSFIGYVKQEVPVTDRTTINLALTSDLTNLNEVVVVGYGTQKKVNVIGSVSQITSEKIENRPVTMLSNALTGQMSGVTVIQRSGQPGFSEGTLRVRGVGSFGASPDALILIDGIPGTMNNINPNDIESISVLKDASSAAIYGARAANGVVLITTRRGKEDKISVNYNGYIGVSNPTEYPELATSWEYAEMFNIANGYEVYSADQIARYRAQDDPDNYPNTNFLKETISRSGLQRGNDISITGGQNSNKYFLSVGNLYERGVVVNNDYNRYNFRLNLENQLSTNLKMSTKLSGLLDKANEPTETANKGGDGVANILEYGSRYPAIHLGRASNGDFGPGPENGGTPVSWLESAGYWKHNNTRTSVKVNLDWNPFEKLTLSAIGGYNFGLADSRQYAASQRINKDIYLPLSFLNQDRNKTIYTTMQFLAEYKIDSEVHDFNILAGYSFEDQVTELMHGNRINFASNDYTVMDMGSVQNQQVSGTDSEWAIQSLFGRLNYQYSNKYLFESTVRYDGSSRFPANNKYALFPSFALGWKVTGEDFFREAVPWVSNLKFKTSWGILGNQDIGNYPYQSTLAGERDYPFGTGISTGAAYRTYKDPTIHWESTNTTDFGLESAYFKGKLTFNANYFYRHTYDILYKPTASISGVLGVGISEVNTGEVTNTGWEFELGHQNDIGNFHYQVLGLFSIINNKVTTLGVGNVNQPNGLVGNGTNLFIGYPMEMYYGYKTDGVFLTDDEVAEWADQKKINPASKAGDFRYVDLNGPEGVPDGVVDPTYDKAYLGSTIPKYTFSLNLSAGYKNIDFSALLQGVTGVSGLMERYVGLAFFNQGTIEKWQMEGRFNPDNPVRYPEYPRLEVVTNSLTPNTILNDFWVLDASYIRLKSIQLGYTLPQSVLNKIRIDHIRFYCSAENLFSLNNYRKGWDPEMNVSGAFYPILSTVTVGVNVKF